MDAGWLQMDDGARERVFNELFTPSRFHVTLVMMEKDCEKERKNCLDFVGELQNLN